jgi:hypothetical protein
MTVHTRLSLMLKTYELAGVTRVHRSIILLVETPAKCG